MAFTYCYKSDKIMVDLIAIIIGVPLGLLIMYALLRNCGDNPQYEAWLTQDKANYP